VRISNSQPCQWAAQKLLVPRQPVMTGSVRLHQRDDVALTQRPAFVRASVGQREIFAIQIEHADLAAVHIDDLAMARRDFDGAGNDLTLPRQAVQTPWRCPGTPWPSDLQSLRI